jgi:hypothetical protein
MPRSVNRHSTTKEADGSWSLAPAHDLMYSTGMGGRHTSSIRGVDDWPTLALLRATGEGASLDNAHITADLEQVRTAVDDAAAVLKDLGCTHNTITFLVSRFDEVAKRAQ